MVKASEAARLQHADVVANDQICREHFRITLGLTTFAEALPGQFVHISPVERLGAGYAEVDGMCREISVEWHSHCTDPYLRRAFSIAGLERDREPGYSRVDLIYREVGRATGWMASRRAGDRISVLGPLGNRFPISPQKRVAWMVAGGVGLPPMLWLAEALHDVGKQSVAFCGSQSRGLMALSMVGDIGPSVDGTKAHLCTNEFSRSATPVVLSTDDGTLGFHGHVGQALTAFHAANPVSPNDVVVYSCGPERMMRFVADFCAQRGIECHLCMERAMACGTGTCQSCVVPVRDDTDPDGWRYRLCCAGGPVFNAKDVVWEPTTAQSPREKHKDAS